MVGFILLGFVVHQFSKELPDAENIRAIQLKVPLRVYSIEGLLISEFGNERRKPISYDETPKILVQAILASEDDGFFEHRGIDFMGLLRAVYANFQSGKSSQGASTITMQVARNFYLSPEKTYARKLKEVLLALRLEQILSKEEILSLYLNKIFLGHRAYGFGAAAEVYYGKPLNELNIAQIAMLAGLPKAPSSSNPLRNPERARIRRNYVLERLYALDWISNDEYHTAQNAPISAKKHRQAVGVDAPYIAEMTRAELTKQFGEDVYWQGLNVYTTIHSDLQIAAAKALRSGLQDYDERHGYRGAIANIDLQKLEVDPTHPEASYEQAIAIYPNSREQIVGLVLEINEKSAKVWTRDEGNVRLSLANAKWAKKYRTANLVGQSPTSLPDILKQGDVIYLKPKTSDNKQNQTQATNTDPEWQLSQLPSISGALISIDPNSGAIHSLIGGYDFFLNKYNRAVQAIRQPGSNIKPFIYSAALDQGFSPASLISGAPIVLTDPTHGTVWRPENYSGRFYGPTRMRDALAKSMNLVSIRLLRSIGIPYARDYVARFGLDMSQFSTTLTMALGSGGVTPLELISAYGVLANGGYRVKPYFIERITDRNGKLLFQAPKPALCDQCIINFLPKPLAEPTSETELPTADTSSESSNNDSENTYSAPRVMTHANNFLTVSMLRDVVRRGTARKAQALKRNDLAGKTGTTNDYVDAWFTGFNSKVVTSVWVGFDDPTTLGRGEAGSKAALPIWIDYMATALKGVPEDQISVPDYIEEGFVMRDSGQRTTEDDPTAIPEFFVIDEFTPEYALMIAQYPNFRGFKQWVNDTALEVLDGEEILKLDEEGVNPEDRIIATDEETEGLF